MRKLARVVVLDEVLPHSNADKLELATVGGWQVVVQKGLYETGDKAIFVEIDGFVPEAIAPFLTKNTPREFNGVIGNRLCTIKLRGELSQGLILPMSVLADKSKLISVGDDVSEILNIQKWELPDNTQLAGNARGSFPTWIQKTDQERVQNLSKEFQNWKHLQWTYQEKLEGSSMTVWMRDGEFGVCSRNIDLKEDENNTFWKVAIEDDIHTRMKDYFLETDSVAIQGELIGPGIQGNIYNLDKHEFRVFDIQLNGRYLSEHDVMKACTSMYLVMVPQLGSVTFDSIEDCLRIATGASALNSNVEREGVVFRCTTLPNTTFKAISNQYLLSEIVSQAT